MSNENASSSLSSVGESTRSVDKPLPEKTASTSPQRVTISFDLKGEPIIKPYRVALSAAARQEIYWKCESSKITRVEIEFEPRDTPFRGASFRCAYGFSTLSGIPLADKIRATPYKYRLTVYKADPKAQNEQGIPFKTSAEALVQ